MIHYSICIGDSQLVSTMIHYSICTGDSQLVSTMIHYKICIGDSQVAGRHNDTVSLSVVHQWPLVTITCSGIVI